ncbi:MAG: TetR/AcrR family transcriptional regulator [Oscillatoriales cyanobacterium SM2_2_1]|nr:TetR/AcrR family transcriptional regulator [Oscillatoriales cyanobacterium SM2_2_1]
MTVPYAEDSRRAAKEAAVLEAAMAEFLSHGYAGASLDRIASRAGVSKATIHSYYQYKEVLFEALIQSLSASRFRHTFGGVAPLATDESPEMVLQVLARHIVEDPDQDFIKFMRMLMGESDRFPQHAKSFITSLALPTVVQLSDYFQSLHRGDPEAAARLFLYTMIGFYVEQEVLHGKEVSPFDGDRLANMLIGLLLNRRP